MSLEHRSISAELFSVSDYESSFVFKAPIQPEVFLPENTIISPDSLTSAVSATLLASIASPQ